MLHLFKIFLLKRQSRFLFFAWKCAFEYVILEYRMDQQALFRALSYAMVFAQERKLNICVGQVADDEVFISCDGRAGCPLKAGATAEVRLSDQVVKLITFGKADQFQAIDQKLRSRR